MVDLTGLTKRLIESDEKYSQINNRISDEFVRSYLRFPSYYHSFFINQNSLVGTGFMFHEKCEILEYLKMGFSEEELRRKGPRLEELDPEDSERPKNAYYFAHGRALYQEHLFYQRIGGKISRKFIPILALMFVRANLLREGAPKGEFYQFGEYNELVKRQKLLKDDIADAIDLFEITGWRFRNKKAILRSFEDYKHLLVQSE